MKNLIFKLLAIMLCSISSHAQTINDLINKVNLDTLSLKVQEFSGEVSTVVNGNTVTVLNRQSNNNDLAAEYIKQQFSRLDNLTITDQVYSTNGRNIIATQLGKTNPNNIYVICAHYDSVANYCADDNASGTIAVLEIARILSTQCLDNTIIYALWDQEENGLIGSNYYAQQAANNGDNILGVLNIDMMAYDGDNDNDFDIDVRNIGGSLAMKDDIISVLNNPTYGFTLNVNVVNPGTTASDHSRFWNQGYSAVLVGEAWSNNDRTPFYHTSGDRFSTLNLPYYHELAKLIMGYMATKAGLINIDNSIAADATTITATQTEGSYQWYNCDNGQPISGANSRNYAPPTNGNYYVEVTLGGCSEVSDCYAFTTLGVETFSDGELNIFPNPVRNTLKIESANVSDLRINLFDLSGKLIRSETLQVQSNELNLKGLSAGIYLLNVKSLNKSKTFKIVKQ
ncbi:M28 family peptidase [Subsaxibacter sp. CAU 1640]|uniref:M28 family peptidase n=1 Tax=Subsaxibacter sp. CAU 1640 TaxID=2933271 RepID=UPI0020031027|nr:M28 family peptidase [Subsaxibacter sp. CAU 1640]MCK7589101.1 M28 family peptidase [Subsaxibacter sp. CAU 1640]